MTERDAVEREIDGAAYLYLARLFEPYDNQLTIVLDEAGANEAKTGSRMLPGGVVICDAMPIEVTDTSRVFTLTWNRYISYSVTEEMHGSCGNYDDEEYTGRLFRTYTKSHFLAFLAHDTGGHFESYKHYKICCLNHIIDVASVRPPTLQSLSRDEAGLNELIHRPN
jgi:hypothetical protein